MKFLIKDFFSKCDKICRNFGLAQEILNKKLHFLCSVRNFFSLEIFIVLRNFLFRQHLIFVFISSEATVLRCSVEKVFLEISHNSQESVRDRVSFLIKRRLKNSLKKRLWHRCFPVNFAKFLRTPFFTEYLRWVLLSVLPS